MADGSVLIDSKINTKGAQEGAKDLEDILDEVAETADESAEEVKEALEEVSDSIEDVDSGAEGAGAGTDNFFGKLVAADAVSNVAVSALKEIGEAMLDFAADSVEAAADIQAQNAQFEQTFQDMAATATASLQAISKETGVAASRMKGSYTSIFAFSKSVGADQKEALDIADRALKAAADSAAYYDRSIEDATETLQSFLKGNYENDAALGIAATETTRNAKANELYATSFEKLSEAQKVDVLLAMVEAGNAASGALGQAAREADSWTNVTGEAAEAFRQLKAVVGEPILDALIDRLIRHFRLDTRRDLLRNQLLHQKQGCQLNHLRLVPVSNPNHPVCQTGQTAIVTRSVSASLSFSVIHQLLNGIRLHTPNLFPEGSGVLPNG